MLEVYQIEALADNYIYVLRSDDEVAVVDPGDAHPVSSFLREMDWDLDFILITHHHPDHTGGNMTLHRSFGATVVGFEDDHERIPGFRSWVREGDEVQIGSAVGKVIEVPGHTTGHIAYYFEEDGLLFTGDTLFSLGCGRLFEGSPEQMWTSLLKLRDLPDETQVLCGHEYTQANGAFALSIDPNNHELQARVREADELRADGLPTVPSLLGTEKKANPFLRADAPEMMLWMDASSPEECFRKLRVAKDNF